MSMNRRAALRGMAGAAVVAATTGGASRLVRAADLKVIRMAPQSDLKVLDPIWTTAFITRNHAYMVYDTLFGLDANNQVKPQMVDTYTTAPDGMHWRFTLRKGLAFHDGSPVTTADVIQSLQRWGQRDGLGQQMFAALDTITAVDANTFQMTFKQPFGLVLDALAKPSANAPFIMPKRVAMTPADTQIDDATGSGPYIFAKSEYRPGDRIVYLKNTKYVPRDEPPSGTAGGKHVYIDRMEWIVMKDAQTQASALKSGAIDMIEWLPAEQYNAMKADPNIALEMPMPASMVGLHMNHLLPPFDNVKISQAAILSINQEALLRAQQVHPELYNLCTSIYPCGSTFASDKTSYFTGKPQFAKARALLKEAGYDGKPIVLMWPADFAVINKYAPVMAALLKQSGFNVDLQSMDWPTLVMRRAKKDPVAQGGWNMFLTGWSAADQINPLYFAPMSGNGTKGWFGWPTDPKLEALKNQFVTATDAAQRKQLATQLQEEVFNAGIYGTIGETKALTALRKDRVSGLVHGPVGVFWGLKRV